jgi:molybdopterin-synthase adenylyltransferase
MRPLLLPHYRTRLDTSEEAGQDRLVFMSEGRRLVFTGSAFASFVEHVVPLLDGAHALEEIQTRTKEIFDPAELERFLRLLQENRVVEDAELVRFPDGASARLAPQIAYLREVSTDPAGILDRLAHAEVTVVGLGPVGAVASTALAAAHVGKIRCVDSATVSAADPALAQIFGLGDVGRSRAEVTRARIEAVSPSTSVEVVTDELVTRDDVAGVVESSDFVLACLDPGLASTTYKLNRVRLAQRKPWSTATVSAFEGIVGPTVAPFETACYLCYRMRQVAGTDDPEAALDDLRDEDESKTDRSGYRENLPFGAGIVGQMLALEAFKALIGGMPSTMGRILTIDLRTFDVSHHVVLRKPWCPACFAAGEA